MNGHINLFEDLELNAIAVTLKVGKKAPTETEKGVPLAPSAKDLKPWYSDKAKNALEEPEDKQKSDQDSPAQPERLSRKREDSRKFANDPLTLITRQLESCSREPSSSSRTFRRPPPPFRDRNGDKPSEVQARLSRKCVNERWNLLDGRNGRWMAMLHPILSTAMRKAAMEISSISEKSRSGLFKVAGWLVRRRSSIRFAALKPDLERYPRENISYPKKSIEENPRGAFTIVDKKKSSRAGLLEGKTVTLKDCISVAGVPCTLGTDTISPPWVPFVDATVVTCVLEAGGIIAGKASTESMCQSASSFTSVTGPVAMPLSSSKSSQAPELLLTVN